VVAEDDVLISGFKFTIIEDLYGRTIEEIADYFPPAISREANA
jgi:hypothetical protein